MAETLLNILIDDSNTKTWVNVYASIPVNDGVNVGDPITIQNMTNGDLRVHVGLTKPMFNFGFVALKNYERYTTEYADEGLWIYSSNCGNVKVSEADNSRNLRTGLGSGINLDAWARQKVVIDRSILHGMFTYNVPVKKYKESLDGVELPAFVNATSVNGKLVLSSAGLGEVVNLDSFRNPRYQPNRGHLFSGSFYNPSKTAIADRNFGMFTAESGVFFRNRNGELYACRRTKIDGVVITTAELIDLPDDIDIEFGYTYDIQMQWRGVGDYGFWIGDPLTRVSRLVHVMPMLGTLTELSIFNPAMPFAVECINNGDAVELHCGCYDITSEGGDGKGGTYGSITVSNEIGQIQVQGANTPVIAVRAKRLVNGLINTRDTLALLATVSVDEHSFFRVWATRDDTAIIENGQDWTDYGDGHLEFIVNDGSNNAMEFDTTKAGDPTFGARVAKDDSYNTSALFEGRTEIFQTAGDTFVFTVHKEDPNKNVKAGVTYEFSEEI